MFVGTDIVEVSRIQRLMLLDKTRFLAPVFTKKEIQKIGLDDPDYQRASGFWAAKESQVKATGTGFRNGISFQDMDIDHDEYGCPYYGLKGKLSEIIQAKCISSISLSISHCDNHSIAVTVICLAIKTGIYYVSIQRFG